jgi:hypothetical protein
MEPKVTIASAIAIVLIFGGATRGVFPTKIEAFGKYTASVLVLILGLFGGSLTFAIDRIEAQPFVISCLPWLVTRAV